MNPNLTATLITSYEEASTTETGHIYGYGNISRYTVGDQEVETHKTLTGAHKGEITYALVRPNGYRIISEDSPEAQAVQAYEASH